MDDLDRLDPEGLSFDDLAELVDLMRDRLAEELPREDES